MPGYQDPFMGGPPQMGPQGQQGPPPRQGPPQQGPGMGGGQPQMPLDQSWAGQVRRPPGSGAAKYQAEVDHYQNQLMMAQINGAPPQVIATLQQQLQQAQRAMEQAGMSEMYNRQINKPQYSGSVGQGHSGGGSSGVGGRLSPSQQRASQDYDAGSQLLMMLYGMGGGGYGQVG